SVQRTINWQKIVLHLFHFFFFPLFFHFLETAAAYDATRITLHSINILFIDRSVFSITCNFLLFIISFVHQICFNIVYRILSIISFVHCIYFNF
ncbi:hypothetical protein PFISCL1PPCAC_27997, partial [Pristionchus fissidentatus]